MSTPASIKIRRVDGSETSIYLHWDGYIDGAGVTLQKAYSTPEKVEELLALGDLSVLGENTVPREGEEHNFEHYQDGVCLAYHRDMSEPFSQNGGDQGFNYIYDEANRIWLAQVYRDKEEFLLVRIFKDCESKDDIAECTKVALDAVEEGYRAALTIECLLAGYAILDTFPPTDDKYCTMFVVTTEYLKEYISDIDSYNENCGADVDNFYLNYIWDETYILYEKALNADKLVCHMALTTCWWMKE